MFSNTLRSLLFILPLTVAVFPAQAQSGEKKVSLHLRFVKTDAAAADDDAIRVGSVPAGAASGQTVAEPTVQTVDGKTATFLAGGEFPYPQVAGGGAISIVYKEFGIRLNFAPTITPSGTIRLQVTSEVARLDFANAFSIQGIPVPAVTTRRVQTELELQSGQSFAITGLLTRAARESFAKVPGIANIPVLQAFANGDGSLVVVVTAEF